MQVLPQQEERYPHTVGNAWVSGLCVSLAGDVDKVETPWAWFQCPEQIADSLPVVKLVLASWVIWLVHFLV